MHPCGLHRTSRRASFGTPLRGLLRVRFFLNGIRDLPHPEERPHGSALRAARGQAPGASRRSDDSVATGSLSRSTGFAKAPASAGGASPNVATKICRTSGCVKELPTRPKQSTSDFVPEPMAGRWKLLYQRVSFTLQLAPPVSLIRRALPCLTIFIGAIRSAYSAPPCRRCWPGR